MAPGSVSAAVGRLLMSALLLCVAVSARSCSPGPACPRRHIGDGPTRGPRTGSLLTPGWQPGHRRRSPQPDSGTGTRRPPNSSITSESWEPDSRSHSAQISREPELQTSNESTFLEKTELSTSSDPVTQNSRSFPPTLTLSSESMESAAHGSSNVLVSASDYISEDWVDSQHFAPSVGDESASEEGRLRRLFQGTSSAGEGDLQRSLNTSPGRSELPSSTESTDVTVPLVTVSSGTSASVSNEHSYSEKPSSMLSTDSKMLSTSPHVSDRSLSIGTRSLSSSLNELLNYLTNDFEESTSTNVRLSSNTIPTDSEKLNSSTEFKTSLSTSPNNVERLSASAGDFKQSLSTPLTDPERLNTSLFDFGQFLISSRTEPERIDRSPDGFKQSLSTSPNDAGRLNTSLNHLKQSLSISPTGHETHSTSENDFDRPSTSLNELKQILTSSLADPDRLTSLQNNFERLSTSLNGFHRSLTSSSIDPDGPSTPLNGYKRLLSTSPNYFERLGTSLNDLERINTSQNYFKRSLSSSPMDAENLSTSLDGIKRTLMHTPTDGVRLSTLQNDFKRSLSFSSLGADRLSVTLTDLKGSERSSSESTNVFENSSGFSPNTLLNISESAFTHAQDNSQRSLETSINGFESSFSSSPNDSEIFTTVQNISEVTSSESRTLNISSTDSKRSISSSPDYVARSFNTSPHHLEWSLNSSVYDSAMFFNTSSNATERLSALPTVSEEFTIHAQHDSERLPNMSNDSLNDTQIDSERFSGTFENASNILPNHSESAVSISSSVFEKSIPDTSEGSPSTFLNFYNISVNYSLNSSGHPANSSTNNPTSSVSTTTNSTDGAAPLSTSIPMDLNDVISSSGEEESFVESSLRPTDTYTNSSNLAIFTSGAETITPINATSRLLPRVTDNFLNTTLVSTMDNVTNLIATTLSSIQSDSQGAVNNSRAVNYNFTTAEPDPVESGSSGVGSTLVPRITAGFTVQSEPPERGADSSTITMPRTTHVHLSPSTTDSPREAGSTLSTSVVVTSGTSTGSNTVVPRASTDIPTPTLGVVTESEFTTVRTSPALLTSALARDKTTVSLPTTSVMETTPPGRTRTSTHINPLTSTKTSVTTVTSSTLATPTSTLVPTSTRVSDTSTQIATTAVVTRPVTLPPTTAGRVILQASTMTEVTTRSTSQASKGNACLSNPCLNGGTCISFRNNRKRCRCPSSWQGVDCSKARTFAGVFQTDNTSRISEHTKLEGDILKILNASLFSLNGYHTSVVTDLSESAATVSVLNMFVLSSNVTAHEVWSSVQNYMWTCGRYNAASCQFLPSPRLSYKAAKLCSFKIPECDNITAECNDFNGVAACRCKDGYFKYSAVDRSCRACDDGYKLQNGTCAPCLFGFGGFNCRNPYKLLTVVIAAAGGGVLLVLGLALTITCYRKEKNDISKLIFKGGDFQRPPYTEVPKNPRISVEWGRETIEMQENGSTKNLLQMTDVYYSPGLRCSDVDRNGLHPYSGVPGSRYSCIYTGQYNPSFSSDESRRRDYF
ncbi:protein HEG homolog 1 isoform X2 [Amblyraja radiata]|uniref:protein HEG homolog 1 isoform X2 n=1 Tax=Amblyraja radiata TaxID=386614 RepID=UPI001401D0C2|nr:protein HEG homolog 1 isoform X2 [Amblyraja radiata]